MAFLGEQSYPAQLERILNKRSESLSFTVVNGGVPATQTDRIIAKLPADLDRHQPDLVVAMMGINDTGSVDPAFQVSGGLRLWRLAKMLYHTLSESQGSEGPPARPAGAPALELGAKGPATNPFPLRRAFKLLVAGQHGEAEAILLPLLHDDDPVHTSQAVRAQALLAALNWQLGRDREAEAYHRAVVAWQHQYRNPKTIRSYEILQDVLAERGLLLAAVQYPGRSAQPLTRLVEPGPDTLIVDNEQVFVEALKSRPIGEIYRDLFGGIFGHMTPYGNQLLAENVAAAILEWIERDPDRWN